MKGTENLIKTYISQIDGIWYAFAGDPKNGRVYSIGRDNPTDGGTWTANWTDSGIKYVAHPSPSRAAAYSKARRAGDYSGEV